MAKIPVGLLPKKIHSLDRYMHASIIEAKQYILAHEMYTPQDINLVKLDKTSCEICMYTFYFPNIKKGVE